MQRAGYGGYGPAMVMRPGAGNWANQPYCGHGIRRGMKPQQMRGTFQPQGQPARSMGGPATGRVEHKVGIVHKQQPQAREDPGTMFFATDLSEWGSPEAEKSQGLCLKRAIDPLQWQPVVDRLVKEIPQEAEGTIYKEHLHLNANEEECQQKFQQVADAISQNLSQDPALATLVHKDALALTDATRKLLPEAKEMIVKLELFGEFVCSRWHRDWYVSRAIVSYNCSATDYTSDSNVDFYELEHCGNNDCIIRDKSRILSTDVGDIVFIKGLMYPGEVNPLVHKSPERKYCDGVVVSRLVLKVDVPNPQGGGHENSIASD
eukprot:TRINITY_DN2475_c0_g1_i5.p1 TRINITY_DN2475_c0_g1~~TRINITY_DN2475_c0_g1_i5.p1  ORF type:complete len:319 (-),score=54.71 TRINITY_DN2475_c0_g1_i5:119-1075(-)